jgi:hypothetical protein
MEVLGQPKRQLSPFRGHFEGKTNLVGCSFGSIDFTVNNKYNIFREIFLWRDNF